MARKNALPEKERAICRRALKLRKDQRLSRVSFAEILKISPERLAQYDYQRVPVPYEVGRSICNALCVNQRWLATGKPPKFPFVPLTEIDAIAPSGAYFSEVYENLLASHLESYAATAVGAMAGELATEDDSETVKLIAGHGSMAQTLEKLLDMAISGMLYHLPESLQSLYAQKMIEASQQFAGKHAAKIEGWWEKFDREFEAEQKSIVDYSTHSADNPGVRLTWKELKSRLKKVTSEHGKKAAAAKFIGVDRSNLNRWLDDDQEPGAEATFRLLEWVTAEEAKTKSPAGVSAPAEPKARKGKIQSNEANQSEPGQPSPGSQKKATALRRKPR